MAEYFDPTVELTEDAFKWKIANDPSYIVSFIVDNNPTAVAANLQAYGYYVETKESIVAALNQLMGDEDGVSRVIAALSVPMLLSNSVRAYDQAIMEVAEANVAKQMAQEVAQTGGVSTRLASWGESGIGVDNILGALAGALGGLVEQPSMGIGGSQTIYPTQTVNTPTQPNNTLRNVLIIIAIIIVLVVLYFVLIRKK